jgi:hypothetical protein
VPYYSLHKKYRRHGVKKYLKISLVAYKRGKYSTRCLPYEYLENTAMVPKEVAAVYIPVTKWKIPQYRLHIKHMEATWQILQNR